MSVRRRRRLDLAFGLLVRIASLLVLMAVIGVFAQMFMVARPLFTDRGMVSAGAEPGAVPGPRRPEFIPVAIQAWDVSYRGRRYRWAGVDHQGALRFGEGPQDVDLSVTQGVGTSRVASLGTFAADGGQVLLAPDWDTVLVISPSGLFELWSLSAARTLTRDTLDSFSGLARMPGHRSFVTWQGRQLVQWHWLPGDGSTPASLARLRHYEAPDTLLQVVPAPSDQRVALLTHAGVLSVWHSTSNRIIATTQLTVAASELAWRSGIRLGAYYGGQWRYWELEESTGAVDLNTLLLPVHYETAANAQYRWFPASAESGEAKFGLVPLLWGTGKAALVALTIALPVGVGAAIFVGFFLSPQTRNRVKPLLELLAAFPSVVLGALTTLLLAPYFVDWLAGILGALVLIPIGILLAASSWRLLASATARRDIVGWLPLLLSPLVLILGAAGFLLGDYLASALPGGSLVAWLEVHHGIDVVHKNALLVGIAMAVATIPLIFSLAEDAIHSVPPVMAAGSLALGATHWQSYRDVVLPVAAPGIVAACMIGLGRAVGETMIVLLVAANTPLMDINLLEGFRSVSATLALELSEAPYESVHYRVLFAAGLALFLLTFVLNSLAEWVRLQGHQHTQERR